MNPRRPRLPARPVARSSPRSRSRAVRFRRRPLAASRAASSRATASAPFGRRHAARARRLRLARQGPRAPVATQHAPPILSVRRSRRWASRWCFIRATRVPTVHMNVRMLAALPPSDPARLAAVRTTPPTLRRTMPSTSRRRALAPPQRQTALQGWCDEGFPQHRNAARHRRHLLRRLLRRRLRQRFRAGARSRCLPRAGRRSWARGRRPTASASASSSPTARLRAEPNLVSTAHHPGASVGRCTESIRCRCRRLRLPLRAAARRRYG